MTRRTIIGLVTVAVLAGGGSGLSRAGGGEDDTYVVIVNPALKITELDRDFVRDAYLKKATELGGHAVHPVQLTLKFSVSEKFVHDVIRKTPAQLQSYWNQQIFSGKGVPPPEAESPAAEIAFVLEHPGAIGFIPAGVDPGGAQVVQLK